MNTSAQISRAERMGGALGRLWKKWLRLDDRICNRLAACSVPAVFTKVALWAIKLVVVGAAFYFAFWLALIFTMGAVVAAGVSTGPVDLGNDWYKTEWRHGPAGWGLYDSNGYRIDPHDEGDEQF